MEKAAAILNKIKDGYVWCGEEIAAHPYWTLNGIIALIVVGLLT